MNYSLDNLILTGSSHKICQDYSITKELAIENTNYPFIAIADGCSSSRDTDFGSRLITRAALWNTGILYSSESISDKYLKFGVATISSAKTFCRELGLTSESLDSTLVLAFKNERLFNVMFFGDGCVFIKKTNGEQTIIEVKYESNAPYYLNYWLNDSRQNNYFSEYGGKVTVKKTLIDNENNISINEQAFNYLDQLFFSFPSNEIETILVSSDGSDSFVDDNNGTNININQIADEYLSFKSTAGEFLKRRIFRFVKQMSKNKITHHDDLGIAAYCVNREVQS